MTYDDYLKETLKSAYAAELMVLSPTDVESFINVTNHISTLGAATFWAPDRIQDMTQSRVSTISLWSYIKPIHSASVRVATSLALTEHGPDAIINIVLAIYAVSIANVTNPDGVQNKNESHVYLLDASYRAYSKAEDDSKMESFLTNNYWLAVYFLFITTGAADELFRNITQAQPQ